MEMLCDRKYEIPEDCKFNCGEQCSGVEAKAVEAKACDCYKRFINWVGDNEITARKEMTKVF